MYSRSKFCPQKTPIPWLPLTGEEEQGPSLKPEVSLISKIIRQIITLEIYERGLVPTSFSAERSCVARACWKTLRDFKASVRSLIWLF